MKLLKIGIGNIDPTVGAVNSNLEKLVRMARGMSEERCDVGCFSEQSIGGYPAEDLVLWEDFLGSQVEALFEFTSRTSNFKTIFVVGLAVQFESVAYNCAAVVYGGKILGIVPKEKLPTYGVFSEKRTYSAGAKNMNYYIQDDIPFGDIIFEFPFGKLAIEVCEDIWSPDGPMRRRAYSGAETVINISASPFRSGVVGTREELISTRASDNISTVVYVNQYGGNDGLAFDGGGYVNQCGKMVHKAPRWLEGYSTVVVDLDRTSRQRRENTTWRSDRETFLREEKRVECVTDSGFVFTNTGKTYPVPRNGSFFIPESVLPPDPQKEYFDDLVNAMIVGLDGYFRKTGAFKCIGIAMSGGKDSALTLLVAYLYATQKLGLKGMELENFIRCFSMPTKFNSKKTKTISRELCRSLGVSFTEVSIAIEFAQAVKDTEKMLEVDENITKLGMQNIQARIRGKRMWDWSNATSGMWLQTGNMSEKAVGYTTIGGDMMGAYSLIGNLPKTVVIELLKYLNKSFKLEALKNLIETEASAELADNQSDEKDLMPFPVLDACYALFVGEKMSPRDVATVLMEMFPQYGQYDVNTFVNRFMKLFRQSIFKWVQAPESVHLGSLDLDRERALQIPVVQSGEWLGGELDTDFFE